MSKDLIKYKENPFKKIISFIKNLFNKGKKTEKIEETKIITNKNTPDIFKLSDEEKIKLAENQRLNNIKLQYDNGLITEDDISDEDFEKIIELYNKEIEQINLDTEQTKKRIENKLKLLKKQ